MSLKEKIKQFEWKVFKYDGKIFFVEEVSIKANRAIIKTDKRVFSYFSKDLDLFIEKIEFVLDSIIKDFNIGESHMSTIIYEPQGVKNSKMVNEKLMQMFHRIEQNPTKENIEKSEALVRISDAMVKNELVQLRYKQIS